jgi:hypothetical protein
MHDINWLIAAVALLSGAFIGLRMAPSSGGDSSDAKSAVEDLHRILAVLHALNGNSGAVERPRKKKRK